jgi:hypothetical protein
MRMPHQRQGRRQRLNSRLGAQSWVTYRYHIFSPDDQFEWQEEREEKQAEFEDLFKLEYAFPSAPKLEPVERYLRSRTDDAGVDMQQLEDEIVSRHRLMDREFAKFWRERRNLRLRCWEDIVSLRKQLRDALKQYHEMKNRSEALDGGDDGD